MISQQMNDSLTKVGPGSDAGAVLRHYWQPAALSDELMTARPVVPLRLLGEDLVLFRDSEGELGLIARYCPHRGADLCYGRLEDNGLRCPFHGWHFDRTGQCVEQPGEPEGSRIENRAPDTHGQPLFRFCIAIDLRFTRYRIRACHTATNQIAIRQRRNRIARFFDVIDRRF